ncbi:uridine kinase family protein [Actinomadura scrupuli]|uniref:uridine kinase family protein n=1 Tax=Actinomadura scrupuli TaxID=559629 RepID=UPI003D9934FB
MPPRTVTYPALAERVRALPPSCGPVRVIAVDGPSAAGKSTLATLLAGALDGAPVVRSDEFPVPWDGDPLAWWPALTERILTPLSAGLTARHRPYDWRRGTYRPVSDVPAAGLLIIEGVGAGHREAPAAYRIWVDAPRELRRRRALRRDGAEFAASWDAWSVRECAHFAADGTRGRADLLVDGAATEGPGVQLSAG